jgi:hypothetical protein
MFDEVEAFLNATQAYRAWLDCGKDLVNHADLFDAYDKAVDDFTHSLYPSFTPNTHAQRARAGYLVWHSVSNGGVNK